MKYPFIIIIIVGTWAVIGAVDAIVTALSGNDEAGASVFVYLGPAIVVAAGLGAYVIKRRREGRDHTSDENSLERSLALHARAGTMIDGLIISLALAVVLLFVHGVLAPLGVFLAVLVTVIDFYIRYAILLRRAQAER